MSKAAILKVFLALILVGMGPLLSIQTSVRAHAASSTSNINPFVDDFTISATPGSSTVSVGSSTVLTITVNSLGSFAGNVLLSTSTFPFDSTLDKTNVTLSAGGSVSASLTLFASGTVAPDTYSVTISGSSGCSLQHITDAIVIATGPDFTMSSARTLLTAPPGGSNSTVIGFASTNGFSGSLTLFAFSTAGPATLIPPLVTLTPGGTGTSTLSISVVGTTQPGNYTIFVEATATPISHSVEIVLVVTGPGFVLSPSPVLLTLTAGQAQNSSIITLTPFGGFTGLVTLTNSSSPPGLLVTLTPLSLTTSGSSTLTVTAPSGTALGFYFISVSGNSTSGFTATADLLVSVKGPDFELSANPTSIFLIAGGASCSSTITVNALFGFTGIVTLTNSTSPPGLALSLSTTSITNSGTSTLTITAPLGTIPGSYFVTVQGVNATGVLPPRSAFLTVDVSGPDFSLAASPSSATVTAPSTGTTNSTSTITVTSLNGFTDPVLLDASVFGPNMSATVSPSTVTGAGVATLTVGVGSAALSATYTVVVTGTSGLLTHSVFVTVTVIAPDFIIDVSPSSRTIDTVSQGTFTITVSPLNGFNSNVDLTAFPSSLNLNASVSPASVLGSGTAVLSVNSTVPGSYTVDVLGVSGLLSHFATISVAVLGPDFSIAAAPQSLTIQAGSNANSTITVTGISGFSGTVTLLALPGSPGLTPSLNTSSITTSQAALLTISVAPDTSPGSYSVEVEGTSGALHHIVTLTINVSTFTLAASPSTLPVATGTFVTSVLTVSPVNGFTGTVTLTPASPPGLLATLNSTTITISGHVQVTISTSPTILPGTYLVNVTGVSAGLTQTATITVTVPVPDFTITATTPITVKVGVTGNSTITIAPISGFTDTVSLTSVSSAGLTCSFSSASIAGGTGTSTLSCSSTSAGDYDVTVNSTSISAGPHTVLVIFKVTDFTIAADAVSPAQMLPDASGTSTITLTGVNGFLGTVDLSASPSTPSGLTCSLPTTATFGTSPQTATLTCSATSAGDYTITVTGLSGSLTRTTSSILFHVVDFTITAGAVSPAQIVGGASATSTVTLTAVNGLAGTVNTSVSGSTPAGLTCTLPTSIIFGTSPQTETLSCNATAGGTYTVTVTGTIGTLSHTTTTITFVVVDFSISASAANPAQIPAGGSGTSTITVTAVNGLTGTVTLTDTVPAGLTCTLPASVTFGTSPQTETLSCSATAAGTYTVTVTGTDGTLSHTTASITFVVVDFTISAGAVSPAQILVGSSGTSTITLSALSGLTGTVTLTHSASTGLTCTLPVSVAFGASPQTATLSCNATATGTYTATVTGTDGTLSHATATITLYFVDFTISAGAVSPVQILSGASATSTITLTAVNGLTGTVNTSVSASTPAGLACTVPASVTFGTSPATETLSCTATAAATYTVTVTGTDGAQSRTTAAITFHFADFTISAGTVSPAEIPAGSSGNSTITITAVNGLTGMVNLSASASTPSGLTCTLPASVSFGSSPQTVTLSCSASTAGAYTVTVQASSGSLSHPTQVSMTITATSGASNLFGLPPTTFYVLIGVILAIIAAVAVYQVRFRKKSK